MTDLRGLAELPTLTAAGRRYRLDYAEDKVPTMISDKQWLSIPVKRIRAAILPTNTQTATGTLSNVPTDSLGLKMNLSLNGIERFDLIPVGQGTQIIMTANWPHPHLDGDALPSQKNLSRTQTRAEWKTSFLDIENNRLLDQQVMDGEQQTPNVEVAITAAAYAEGAQSATPAANWHNSKFRFYWYSRGTDFLHLAFHNLWNAGSGAKEKGTHGK